MRTAHGDNLPPLCDKNDNFGLKHITVLSTKGFIDDPCGEGHTKDADGWPAWQLSQPHAYAGW
eukprot:6201427-Pleurochrysis_carterae.AAC.1